jgi:glycosyltransferase involved in cell wall biosynthesis
MKIALITAFYDENEQVNEFYLAKKLSELGHKVSIIVSRFSIPRYGMAETINSGSKLKNVNVIRLDSFGIKKKGMLFFNGLNKVIKDGKFDVVHLQEWFMPMGFQLRKIKNLVLTQRIERIPFAVKIIYWVYGRKLLENAKSITSLTSDAKKELEKLGLKKEIKIIPNGVDTTIFYPQKHSESSTFRILFAGRLAKEKGVSLLINACSKLNFSYELKIIGSGDEELPLKKLAKELKTNAGFIGKKQQAELPKYYSEADVLAVPSIKEPFGFVTLEALSCGTPVAGSDIGGMRDIITDKVGVKFPAGDSGALSEALKKMHETAKELRKNCREHALKNYSWDVIAEKYLEEYQ